MENMPHKISASVITVEVTDQDTGITYKRELPIDYYETANCLRLRGENQYGAPSELILFTNRGVSRLNDLTGGGSDTDSCGNNP